MPATTAASPTAIQMPGAESDASSTRSRPFGSQSIFCSDASPMALPRSAVIAPSVTTNGMSRNRPTQTPISAPIAVATATATMTATKGLEPPFRSRATITVVSATSEPVERSMPPVTMTSVIPRAQIATTTLCRLIVSRFCVRRNECSGVMAAKMK